jgi:hypothetical protein
MWSGKLPGIAESLPEGLDDVKYIQPCPCGFSDDWDLGVAENAQDQAMGWYEIMRSLRQTMLNLLSADLFHLT